MRFLEQSSFGPTLAEVERVKSIGIRAYLNEQFDAPASGYPSMPLLPVDSNLFCQGEPHSSYVCYRDNYTMDPLQRTFFRNAFYKPDQLRQRVAFALHQIFVVSGRDMNQTSWMVPYLQTLDRHAFGISGSSSPTSRSTRDGQFPHTGATQANPNEIRARDSPALLRSPRLLNRDGTPKLDAEGRRVPATRRPPSRLRARLTGWNYDPPPPNTRASLPDL